tara:strand:+ start:380 stop:1060 length:681 start_codon:yes stop_codon:yes gene_type:complete
MSQRANKWIAILAIFAALGLTSGCASTAGSAPPPIPEGMGHLILEAGMINEVNYYIINQETEETVYEDMMRPPATSPSAYERGYQVNKLHRYLEPGIYTVMVVTDFKEPIEYPDIEVKLGTETYVPIQIGKFMLNFTIDGTPRQMRFLLWDYNLRHVIGEGMTSTQVRHYITQPGIYKVHIEQLASGIDQRVDVEVAMGRVTPVNISIDTGAGADEGEGAGDQGGP